MAIYGGIDLGGTKIQAVVLDSDSHERHGVLGQARHETPHRGGPRAVAAEIEASLREAAAAANVACERLEGIGVGAPGEVDAQAGTVAHAGNLPDWEAPFALARELSRALADVPVRLGNDVGVATRAELELGAGQGARSLLGVFWGTGVGGALILEDGELWRGRGAAGEIGHMVVKLGGARCPCGRRGCLEAYAGRRAMEAKALRKHAKGHKTDLFEIMAEKGHDALSSGVWAHALAHGDKLAHELIDRAVRALGAGIASAVNLLDVERVVLGGGLGTRFGEEMAARVATAMQPHLFNDERPPELRVAALGDLGGAIGAAMLCGPVG
jgi:glucokinase